MTKNTADRFIKKFKDGVAILFFGIVLPLKSIRVANRWLSLNAVPYVVSIILLATSAQMIISLYQSAITIRLTKVFSTSGDVENMSNANGQKERKRCLRVTKKESK